jgi:4-alpha-glucanotransferase
VWRRPRAGPTAALFDGFRVDHLVGFYRTYGRPADGPAFFSPSEEAAQIAQGEEILHILLDSGAEVLAEDLGSIPPFVHASLARLGVPGFKVIRWERAWDREGHPYVDPASYPATSVSMTGTHDNEPLATWWDATSGEERAAAARMPRLQAHHVDPQAPWSDAIRDAWLDQAYGSASDHLFLPVQDIFGWRDRINTPAIVDAGNWTWMLPWPIDRWPDQPDAAARAAFCRALAVACGRGERPAVTR